MTKHATEHTMIHIPITIKNSNVIECKVACNIVNKNVTSCMNSRAKL